MPPLSKITDLLFLRTPEGYWTYSLMCIGIGIWLLSIAVTGFLNIPTGNYLFNRLEVKSVPIRIVCFVLTVGFLTVAIWMFRHSLPPLRDQ